MESALEYKIFLRVIYKYFKDFENFLLNIQLKINSLLKMNLSCQVILYFLSIIKKVIVY